MLVTLRSGAAEGAAVPSGMPGDLLARGPRLALRPPQAAPVGRGALAPAAPHL